MLRRANPDETLEPGLRMRMLRDLRRLHTQHDKLASLLDLVRDGLEKASIETARVRFARFRDALESHMGIEDEVYFPALHGLEPRLDGELTKLVEEHRKLRAGLEALHETLGTGQPARFIAELERFAAEHASHEHHEEGVYDQISQRAAIPGRDPA